MPKDYYPSVRLEDAIQIVRDMGWETEFRSYIECRFIGTEKANGVETPLKDEYILLLLGNIFSLMQQQGIQAKDLPKHVREFYLAATADEDAQEAP